MSRALLVHHAGPGVTVQDMGRPGYLAQGLSRGGALDTLAMAEGAALLGAVGAALEMPGSGGVFEVTQDTRIALTGAPMAAHIDGARIAWNASHLLPAGARLRIGGARQGSYGYLHLGGGLDLPEQMGGRGTHLAAGLGQICVPGMYLPLGQDWDERVGLTLPEDPRFEGGSIRAVPSLQTPLFDPAQLARFQDTDFQRDPRGNRMGVRLRAGGAGFAARAGLSVLSEVIVPGDIQITGDGTPFVLLAECQTTGGYPRIGTVLPADLPRVVQARPGATLRIRMIALEEAVEIERNEAARRAALPARLRPLLRDPREMGDLLSYNLVSGATVGTDPEGNLL